MLQIILQNLLLLHLKSIHGYFGLPQHIICTYPDQDMKYTAIHLHIQGLLSGILSLYHPKRIKCQTVQKFIFEVVQKFCHIQLCYVIFHRLQKIYNVY